MTEMYVTKKRTQTARILEMLEAAGETGVRNYDLMQVSYQWPAKVWILRHKHGLNIESKHLEGSEWQIILHPSEPVQKELF